MSVEDFIPGLLFALVFAVIFVVLSRLIARVLPGLRKWRHLMAFPAVIALIYGLAFANNVYKHMKAEDLPVHVAVTDLVRQAFNGVSRAEAREMASRAILELKKERLYEALFSAYREAETVLWVELEAAARRHGPEGFSDRYRPNAHRVAETYVARYASAGSAAAAHALLEHTHAVLMRLEDRPEACVTYYRKWPRLADVDLDPDLKARETELRAGLLESALRPPAFSAEEDDRIRAMQMLVASYWINDLDTDSLDLVDGTGEQDPADVCRAVTTLTRALLAMTDQDAAYVFRSLMLSGDRSLPAG